MAKKAGYINLEGTLDDLTFYKNRDGNFITRRKGGVSKKRLLTDLNLKGTWKYARFWKSSHRCQIPKKFFQRNRIQMEVSFIIDDTL
jgi:hypothetical protein